MIRAERERRAMNRTEFAKLIGVSRQSLIAYEEAGQAPKLELAATIAQRLGMTLDELAGIRERVLPVQPIPVVVIDGVEYAPATARGAGDAASREAIAALEEAERVARDAEEATRLGRAEDDQKRRRSA